MTTRDYDRIELFQDRHLIQHGPANDRIYLMKMGDDGAVTLPDDLIAFASQHNYSKVFAKVPAAAAIPFRLVGFKREAAIPGYYGGCEQADFLCCYLHEQRRQESDPQQLDEVLCQAQAVSAHGEASLRRSLPEGVTLRSCGIADVEQMAVLYRSVFASYPFPVDDPEYLRQTMHENIHYVGAEWNGQLIALASAEQDVVAGSAEMTDFATLPEWRGQGLGAFLLAAARGDA